MPPPSQKPKPVTKDRDVNEREGDVKDILYRGVIDQELVTVKEIASETGYKPLSLYKAFDSSILNGLSFRVVDTAAKRSRTIAARLLDHLRRSWLGVKAPASVTDLLQRQGEARLADAESDLLELLITQDGYVSAEELRRAEDQWAKQDAAREEVRGRIREMAADGGRLVDFRKQVAG